MKTFVIENFAKGYDDSVGPEFAPPESTQDAFYINYERVKGALSKEYGESASLDTDDTHNGAVYKPSENDDKVQLLYEGRIDTSGTGGWTNKRLAICGGKVFQYCAGDQIIRLGSGSQLFHETELLDATHYIDNFYIVGGYDYAIRTWSGKDNSVSVASGLETGANRYRAKYICVFRNRLFLGNVAESSDSGVTWTVYPNRVRWSGQALPAEWDTEDNADTDASYTDVLDKDGDEVVRVVAFGEALFIFKRNSIHRMDYTGGDLLFEKNAIDPIAIGNAGFTVAKANANMIFLNHEGLQYTDGKTVNRLASSKKIDGFLEDVYIDAIHNAYGVADDTRQEYHIIVPYDGGYGTDHQNDHILTWNWKYDRWRIRSAGSATRTYLKGLSCLGLYSDDKNTSTEGTKRLVIGRHDGRLTSIDESIKFDPNGAINDYFYCYHMTPWLDFGSPGVHKEILKLQPMWSGTASATLLLYYMADGDSSWTSSGAPSFTTTDVIEQPIIPVRANGRKFRFYFFNTAADEDFTVYRLKIFYNERSLR